jgi:hypothetical protein
VGGGREGVGGGRSTGRSAGQYNLRGGKGRCFVRARAGGFWLVSAGSITARSTLAAVCGDRVRALQHALYRAAKADPGRRFHALFDKVHRSDVLDRAWEDVRRNHGAAGIDRVTLADVEEYGSPGCSASWPRNCGRDGTGRCRPGGCSSRSRERMRRGRCRSRHRVRCAKSAPRMICTDQEQRSKDPAVANIQRYAGI